EVVDFVLHDAGQPAIALQGLFLAVDVLVDHRDLDEAFDLGLDAGERQAALLAELALLLAHELWVADRQFARTIVLAATWVEHEELLFDPDLGRSQADAALLI